MIDEATRQADFERRMTAMETRIFSLSVSGAELLRIQDLLDGEGDDQARRLSLRIHKLTGEEMSAQSVNQ